MPPRSKVTLGNHATDRLLQDTHAVLMLREVVAAGDTVYLSASASSHDETIDYYGVRLGSDRKERRQVSGDNFAYVLCELLDCLPTRRCKGCLFTLPLTAFGVNLANADGVAVNCLECMRASYRTRVQAGETVAKKTRSSRR